MTASTAPASDVPENLPDWRDSFVTYRDDPRLVKNVREAFVNGWRDGILADRAARPAPGVEEAARELLADLDRSLNFTRDHAVIAATNANVKRLRSALASVAST